MGNFQLIGCADTDKLPGRKFIGRNRKIVHNPSRIEGNTVMICHRYQCKNRRMTVGVKIPQIMENNTAAVSNLPELFDRQHNRLRSILPAGIEQPHFIAGKLCTVYNTNIMIVFQKHDCRPAEIRQICNLADFRLVVHGFTDLEQCVH